jgi:HK97 family phage major capsid protein
MALENIQIDEQFGKTVLDEIKVIKDNTKEQYDQLRTEHEQFKNELKNLESKAGDPVAEEKIKKFAESLSIRQDELDKKATERMDAIEVALNRPGKGSSQDKGDEYKEAKEFYIHANAARQSGGNSYRIARDAEIDTKAFEEYKKNFEAYLRLSKEGMEADEIKTLLAGSDPDGGYTVTPFMSNRINTKLFETDPIRALASIETISTDAIEMMVDTDEAGAEWVGETVLTTNVTTPQMQKKRISVNEMQTKPAATQTLLEDSGINIEAWLSNKVADKFARTEAASFVEGNGVQKPRGFLTYATGTSWGQIEQVAMGAAATLTADGFIKVKYSLIEQYLNRGTWLMNRTTLRDAMLLKNGVGDYIWKPSLIAGDPTSTICGLPVRMSTTMPAVAANALSVALADWRESYLIVDRLGITVMRDPYSSKPLVEFLFRKRVGGDIINYQSIKIGKVSE